MTASRLKDLYCWNNPEGHFFDRNTMRFFGDTMRNFGVRDYGSLTAMERGGIAEIDVWELYRKRPVAGGMYGHCAYFRKDNGQVVYHHK
jgi:hypothetical protein